MGTFGDVYGITARTSSDHSPIQIANSGKIIAAANGVYGQVVGIDALSTDYASPISITNSGGITATSTGQQAFGIRGDTLGPGSKIDITNSGDITATGPIFAVGIDADGLLLRPHQHRQ